ncbi:PIN domain-containing protein [Nonomuraea africana]|uniref:PIN domain-containing protein n=1 Tax=Nonomuraea africana TaxID=46171 RepID=UPI0033EF325D
MSINVDLPQHLIDQWRARISRFLQNNPQNRSLFTVELPNSVEGMTEALRNILEPGTDTFDEVRSHAAAGSATVGMLAAYAGKPYAATLIQRGPGCLPIATRHTQHQIYELRSAVEAVDGPVAIDTSSLFILRLVSDEWEPISSYFSRMFFSNPSRTDIAHTVANYSRQISGMLGWDRQAGIPRMYEVSRDEQTQWRQHAEWMLDKAQHLDLFSRTALTNIFSEPHQNGWDERFLPWLAALDYAIEQGVPLYADDIALRSLARERGIPTFGTTSLLEALVRKGDLHRIKYSTHMDELRFNYCVDLPLDVHSLARVAERENWRAGASSFIFSRPIVWSTAEQALSAWRGLCSQAIRRDPKHLPGWLYQAVRGACESRENHERGHTAAALMLMALTISGVDRLLLSDLLVATRAALQTLNTDDPLIPFTRLTLDLMSNAHDLQFAARAVLSLTEHLPETDKATIRTIVFSDSPGNAPQ